ncbi:MAG: PRC-barrel domain-containing protein [Solirubrobacteraceae bacterium]
MPGDAGIVVAVDEGLPISYQLLEGGVPVLACDGEQVGTVGSVLSAPEEDVFHGLLIKTPGHGMRFVEADVIASIHEHGVDLRIDSASAQNLPGPEHKAPVYDEDPATQTKWSHVVRKYTGRNDWHRE